MEKVYFKLFVFCAIISLAYSFMCYECGLTRVDQYYSADQCEKDQKKVNCTGDDNTCFKFHKETTDGIVQEMRGCTEKSECDGAKKICLDNEKMEPEDKLTKCQAACCVSTGDTLQQRPQRLH